METRRCPSCAAEISGAVCPHCGFPVQNYNDAHQLPVGTVLRGRYQVGKVLGQGGFGITYLGWDTLMETVVAIKEFYPSSTVNRNCGISNTVQCNTSQMSAHYQTSLERFLREARALVKFREIPEIVDILDFIEENNTAYIVMEFVRGVDLAKYIRNRGGRLSVEETFRILKPVMEALATVHKKGIVHRDISPDNIILDPMGGAKLLDFGAVRSVENPDVDKGLNKSTEAILKHGFAPLEQYNTRGSLGPWTDEYAMCATVFYCLTGRIPEEASIRVTEGIDPDWDGIPGLPEHQKSALEKGMSVRAKDRYPDMDGLIAALFEVAAAAPQIPERPASLIQTERREDTFVKTEAITAHRQQPVQPATPEPVQPVKTGTGKKKGLVPALIAAVLVIAVAVGGIALFSSGGGKKGETPHREAPAAETPAAPEAVATEAPKPESRLQKVALITDGATVEDMSYNQACWDGITRWCVEWGVDYTFYQPSSMDTPAYVLAVTQAIAAGADTIVLPGYAFGGALIELMDFYPDVKFLCIDMAPSDLTADYITCYDPTPNVAGVTFAVEESGYLAGYAAVKEGFTRLGFLGGVAVPQINLYGSGFIQGADAAARELGITVDIRCFYANQFFGDKKMEADMVSWYESGTEVIFVCGGGLYTSVAEACDKTGGYMIGVDVDQAYVSGRVFTSAMKNMSRATYDLLEAANSDEWDAYGGRFTTLTAAGDHTGIVMGGNWTFRNFTQEDYVVMMRKIAAGEISPDDTPELYRNVTNTNLVIE